MNQYNPNIHHRKSIRLKGYDYTKAGLYFVTICCQHRECFFGNIENGEMIMNDSGRMIEKWYHELMNKFSDIICHEMIVMPNHFHCIIEKTPIVVAAVGADLCVCPISTNGESSITETPSGVSVILGEHIGSPLHGVVQWFKTMTTNEYIRGVKNLNWKRFDRKLWQRNYYEHIIRNEESYQKISNYIINNPKKWYEDKLRSP